MGHFLKTAFMHFAMELYYAPGLNSIFFHSSLSKKLSHDIQALRDTILKRLILWAQTCNLVLLEVASIW